MGGVPPPPPPSPNRDWVTLLSECFMLLCSELFSRYVKGVLIRRFQQHANSKTESQENDKSVKLSQCTPLYLSLTLALGGSKKSPSFPDCLTGGGWALPRARPEALEKRHLPPTGNRAMMPYHNTDNPLPDRIITLCVLDRSTWGCEILRRPALELRNTCCPPTISSGDRMEENKMKGACNTHVRN
jgi:hypothetical protein